MPLKWGNKGRLSILQTFIKKKSQRMPRVNQSGSRPLVNDNISKQSGRKILSSASALPVQEDYLAVVMAVHAMKNGQVKKIILTRPAVEAGESLGFLPGDLKEKVDPYLRPLYDALHDVLGAEHTARLIERGTIEIAPLAYMRGRTWMMPLSSWTKPRIRPRHR